MGVGKALADRFGGDADGDGEIRHVLGDHRVGADDGAVADRDAGHDHRAVADPGVVADRDAVVGAPLEERRVVGLALEVPARSGR